MAGATGGTGSSSPSPAPPAPKILLAKPGLVTAGSVPGKFGRPAGTGAEDDGVSLRSRLPPLASLNLLSDSWEFHTDRILPFLTDNTEFTVVGVIGPPGVGKSTIMNELYGFDGSLSGMLPPFAIQSEETRAMARHCTVGIEPRISAERIILLDTQPVFSPSVLAEMMRPDGSSTISVLSGETLSAELAHELMSIQLGVLLASICNILLVVSEGVHDINMWRLLLTVDLLKHSIPDPSSLSFSHLQSSNLGSEKENKDKVQEGGEEYLAATVFVHTNSNLGSEKENKDKVQEGGEEYLAAPVFVHTKLRDEDLTPFNCVQMRKALAQYFSSSLFMRRNSGMAKEHIIPSASLKTHDNDSQSTPLNLFVIPFKNKDDSASVQYESYNSMLWKLRDQVLSMTCPSFARTVSERDWLKNSAKIWDLVKKSPIIAEYSKTLQSSGMFRR